MKKLRKLSLQQLDKVELGKRQEGLLLGGGTPGSCRCGSCSSTGTPSSTANQNANDYNVIPLLVPMKSCVYAETVAHIQLHRIYNA